MRAPVASFGGALGTEMMSGGRQAGGEAVAVPKPTRYNVDSEARLSESPPSGSMLGSQPPTFFKMPSKYYALVGRSAVQDAGGSLNSDAFGATGSAEGSGSTRSGGLRRAASEALFRIGGAPAVQPTSRPSHVLTGVDVTPHYDTYASVLPGASSHGILSHFSQQSSALTQSTVPPPPPQQPSSSGSDKAPAAAVQAAAKVSQPAAAQQSSLLSRGASLLNFFSTASSSPSTSPTPSPMASPRPPVESAAAAAAPSAPAAAAAGAPGKLFFSRISSPDLLSTFSAKSTAATGSRRKGRGVNAKDLNALTPMDM